MMFRVTASLVLLSAGAHWALAQKPARGNALTQLSGSIRDLTNRVSPAVVEILVTGYTTSEDGKGPASHQISRQSSSGSGVIVDREGYIVTNAHVVQGAIRVEVLLPRPELARTRSVGARIIGLDTESDLALIRIDESALPTLAFGDSDGLRQGDLVFAIGSPMGLQNSVSMGVVSAPARAVSDDNPILYIQTDASINPGNSGGALVNTEGLLIGMNTFIVSTSGGNEGIGFAIPSNVVRNVYEQLKRKGKVSRGSVGLFVQDISPLMAKGLSLPAQQGVIVSDVEPGGPAEGADLHRRDVVLSLNGHAMQSSRQFDADVYRRENGDKVTLVVQRGDERITANLEVKAQAAPTDPLAALASPEKNLIPRLGILCIEIDKDVAQLLPDLRRSFGVIVAAKAPQGQTQFVDLLPGDIIHTVNNTPIAVLSTFQEMVNAYKPGDAVVLQVERDGRLRYVAFEIE